MEKLEGIAIMRKIIANIIYYLLYLLSLLPLRVHYLFSDVLYFFLRYIFRYRSSTIFTNISRSFPKLGYKEIYQLAGKYYSFMCDIIVESVWQISHSDKKICQHIKVEDEEVVNDIQSRRNCVLIVMGHCGNWEMISGLAGVVDQRSKESFLSHPIYILYKAPENKTVDILLRKMRMNEYKKFSSQGEVIESKSFALHLLKNKNQKCSYVLIADQNPIGDNPIVANFLNQKTAMHRGPEYLANKMSLPVVYLYMDRLKRGQYKIKFELITEDASGEKELFVTQKFASLLERDLQANNVNWLWSHRRWKRKI